MYKRNERAFDHDVTRFMARNGLKMGSAPFWQNQRVALFHLFLAVHERGGFTQVLVSALDLMGIDKVLVSALDLMGIDQVLVSCLDLTGTDQVLVSCL